MSITNYAELQTAIGTWLHRTDLASIAPDLIGIAERKLFRKLRIRAMENTSTGTVGSSVSLPTGFVEMIALTVTSGGVTWPLTYIKPSEIDSSEGSPQHYSIVGDSLIFIPSGTGYTYNLTYYKPLDSVSLGSNWLIANAPEVYLFAALVEAADYTRDTDSLQKYAARLDAEIAGLMSADNSDRYGNNLVVRVA